MAFIPARELRNHTAAVLKRAQEGEEVTITVNGSPVASLTPLSSASKPFLTKAEFLALRPSKPDARLAADIGELSDGTTDELGPIA